MSDTCVTCGHPTSAHFVRGRKVSCAVVRRQLGPGNVVDGTGPTRAGATPVGGATRKISGDGRDFSRSDARPRGRLLKTKAAADYLGITATRLRRLVGQGDVAVIRNKTGRLAGFYAEDLDAWVERRRQPAASERKWRLVDARMRDLIEGAS